VIATYSIRRGVTLLEMLVVVAIVGLIAAVSFPSFSTGLDSIRLQSAADSVASFIDAAANRTERKQEIVEIVIDPKANRILLFSTEPGFQKTLQMPRNISLAGDEEQRRVLMPGGALPRFSIDLVNAKGGRKRVTMDPITETSSISIPGGP